MIKHHYFFTALLSIATQLCWAMENKLPISRPTSVICFPNNIVAIAGQEGCCLYNFAPKKFLKILDEIAYPSIDAHPNKKKLAVASETDLSIYDIPTGNKIWKKHENWYSSPTFNPIDDTIILHNGTNIMYSFNYKNNTRTSYRINTIFDNTKIIFHPKKQECIVLTINTISLLCFDPSYPLKKSVRMEGLINGYRYSPDGSLIVVNNTAKGNIILSPNLGIKNNFNNPNNEPSCTIIFHPTSFIFATLSRQHDTVYYWNAKHNRLITTTPLIHSTNNHYYSRCSFTNCMDFSCNGTQLIIALEDSCIVLEVSFDALYQPDTKNKCIFTYLMLQNYLCGDGNALPRDITHVIIKYLLAASKYSLSNY